MESTVARGVRAGVAAYLLWGFLTVYWKQLAAFEAVELIGWRIAMAAIVMGIVVTLRSRWRVIRAAARSPRLVGRVAIAGAILTVNWTMYVYAVVTDRVIETALGYFLAPLGTIAIGVLVLGERLSPAKWFAVACAVTAVAMMTAAVGQVPVIAIAIAVSWSLYGLAKRTVALGPIESLTGETLVLLLPAITVVAWGATRGNGVPATAGTTEWLFVIGTGVVTAVPLLLFSVAARSVPFTLLGPLNYLVPLVNFALGWWVYGESVPLLRFIGFVLIWAALVAVSVDTIASTRRARAVPALPVP